MFDTVFSPGHIILILIAALLIFGPKRLPDIGKSLGKGIKEFKGALSHIGDDEPAPPPAPPVTPNAGAAPASAPPAPAPPASASVTPPGAAPAAQPPTATPVTAPPGTASPNAQSNGTPQG